MQCSFQKNTYITCSDLSTGATGSLFSAPEAYFQGLFNDMICSLINTEDQEEFPYQAKDAVDTDCHVLG
jgi:hypothetical protein